MNRLLRRVPRRLRADPHRQQVLPASPGACFRGREAHRVLTSATAVLRLGYAWAALDGTPHACNEIMARHDAIELDLVRHDSPTAGLAEGLYDVAIVRRPGDDKRFDSIVVGLEQAGRVHGRRPAVVSAAHAEHGRDR